MKKQLFIISVFVIIISIFVSCSANSSSGEISTTAVTDSNGITHYYEPVTDDKGKISITDKEQGVFAEIETQSNGKAVTKNDSKYVTNEHTTVLPIESVSDGTGSTKQQTTAKSSSDTTKNAGNADNDLPFEISADDTTKSTEPTTERNSATTTEEETANTSEKDTATTETTTKKENQPATDKDGWITKWY